MRRSSAGLSVATVARRVSAMRRFSGTGSFGIRAAPLAPVTSIEDGAPEKRRRNGTDITSASGSIQSGL